MSLKFDEKNFNEEVVKSEIPVIVDFWAEWCGPCHIMSPIIDEVAKVFEGKVKIGKVNVDENQVISSKYGIMSIPTILAFKNGKVIGQLVGARPKKDLVDLINKVIA
ncbi:MAG: Thioredoxin [candidate division CPR1 bacterium GW2011_GWA2_42_17]|uniref:Thioredoxin n=1 Tax=candidate division CPR1 bacterium GW2011_GWA2_42_17 TaxID=1618341 RepID=A0A0G0YZ38_9BACT|nr:MAG: Thioredoxin [candidate division CPR1 bacterium GW2011_GWA2_42_17]